MPRKMLAPMALMVCSGLAVGAEDFARLAPPEAGLVVCVGDYARSKDLLLGTPLGSLVDEPVIARMLEEARKSQIEQFDALAADLGIDIEEWPEPSGMVGVALSQVPIEGAEEWGPQFTQAFVAAADFGPAVDDVAAIVNAIVEKGLDQGLIEIEVQDVGGVEVLTLTTIADDDEAMDDDMDGDMMDFSEPTGLAGLLNGLETLSVAIDGSVVYLGSDAQGVVDMLDRAGGADTVAMADDELFAAAMDQHPGGTSDYLVAFPGRLGLVESMGMGLGFFLPPGMEVGDLLGNLGISNMKVLSLGAHLESQDAQIELSLGVLDLEKTGLVSLLDVEGPAWEPPSFVSPDAAAATRLMVDFARLPEIAREFWGTLPPELQDEGGMIFEQAMQFVEPIAPLLGPEVHLVQTIERPFSVTSAGMLYVIPTSNETPIKNLLVLGSSNGAFTTRDFGETKIYDAPDGSISLAVAYGQIFIGPGESVENGLRLASAGGGESLADDGAFQDATSALPGTGNAMQFTRTLDILEYSLWAAQNAQAIARQQLLDSGWTEEEIEEYGMNVDTTPEWAKELSIDMFQDAVGDISMEVTPTDDGFRGRILILNPR